MLLGVNSDEDRDDLKNANKEEGITWRSWWDAGSPDGPIQTKWQVTERPTVYLLDAEGVIRHKNVTEDELEKAIDGLLKELANKSSKQ